jgi:Leucine-rich repeat (LRR) protein
VPEFLDKYLYLQYLDLSTNQLSTIPESIKDFEYLQTLHLSNNLFRDLPSPLAQLILSEKFFLEHDNFHARGNYYRTYDHEFDEKGDLIDEEINEEDIVEGLSIRKI